MDIFFLIDIKILFGLAFLGAVNYGHGDECPAQDPMNTTVMLPYPQDCTKFYMCHHGQASVMECPWGTYFNANKSICDWPSKSGCTQSDAPTVCNPADLVPLYPVPNNCTAFISCVGSKQIELSCPDGLYFSPSLKVCVWPKDSGCVQQTTTVSPNHVPTDEITTTANIRSNLIKNFARRYWFLH